MEKILIDTHALLWHLQDDRRLSQKARSLMDQTSQGEAILYLSIISLMEIDYLVYKKKVNGEVFKIIEDIVFSSTLSALKILDINWEVLKKFRTIPPTIIPELPDRIIAATALAHQLPLITKDSEISSFKQISVIW